MKGFYPFLTEPETYTIKKTKGIYNMNKLFCEPQTPVELAIQSAKKIQIYLAAIRFEKAEEELRELARQVWLIRHNQE